MAVHSIVFLLLGVVSNTIGSTENRTEELSLQEMTIIYLRQLSAKMEEMQMESRDWRNNISAKLEQVTSAMERERLKTQSLQDHLEKLEGRCVYCEDVLEMNKTLRNHSSLSSRLSQHIWEVENSCAGEPPSIRNGKPLKFDRNHKSVVRYECDQDFVLTGNSTVLCEYGKWEGHPPICTFFDTTFTLVADFYDNYGITCYSDRYSQDIEFSRVLDTESGRGLPTAIRQKGRVLSFTNAQWEDATGAYECRFHVDNRSAGIVATLQRYAAVEFWGRPEAAIIGETVELKVRTNTETEKSKLRWRHNGVHVSSWDGQTEVEISSVQPADAGIYECHEEGKRSLHQALFRLIVRKCQRNRYGENCEQECPVCYNGGACHDLLGVCICPIGFTGKNCELACGEKHASGDCAKLCLGRDCQYKRFCKQDPFGCSCFPGLKGFWCKSECEPGWYGAGCKQPCHCAGDCDIYTGACSGACSPGWTGPSCQIEVIS